VRRCGREAWVLEGPFEPRLPLGSNRVVAVRLARWINYLAGIIKRRRLPTPTYRGLTPPQW
jgi:hypothetical protein